MKGRKEVGPIPKVRPICAAIRAAIEESGLSRREIGERIGDGVTTSMVARWAATDEPTLSVIVALENVLGLNRGELLRRAGYVGAGPPRLTVPAAIRTDPRLDARAQKVLLATYRSLTNGTQR